MSDNTSPAPPDLQPESPTNTTAATTTAATTTASSSLPATPTTTTPNDIADTSDGATAATDDLDDANDITTTAPPQPPLPLSDAPFSLPQIVDGIDPNNPNADDLTAPTNGEADPQPHSTVGDMFNSLTARVSRVVRLANLPPPPPPPPALLLFGDSLTQRAHDVSDLTAAPGWAALLHEAYIDTADVFVRGHSGYNTRWAMHIFPRVLRSCLRAGANIRLVSIFFGTNDARDAPSEQHVPVAEYAANLEAMVKFVRSLSLTPLLLTPPPISPPPQADTINNRQPDVVKEYAQACVQVAKQCSCHVVNLHAGFQQRAGDDAAALDRFFNDGIHLSPAGNRAVFEMLIDSLAQCAPELVPAALSRPFPGWADIDPDNPAELLGSSELAVSP